MKTKIFMTRMKDDIKMNWALYLIILPVLIYYIMFHYVPMYGARIAFLDYSPGKDIAESVWVGLKHFKDFFGSYFFGRVLRNTITINLTNLVFGFPAPILLALLMNEIRSNKFKRCVQTVTYLPHFISMVVIAGLIKDFTSSSGVINSIIAFFGGERTTMLNYPEYFVPIYVISEIWQSVGFNSIIYLAAISSVDMELYEAAMVDGANRWKQTLVVTLPAIMPTIVIMLILRLGSILSVGFEKIILLYNPAIYETADVISSFVYRKGLIEQNYSFSTAVGLFNSTINFLFVIAANQISRRIGETSLW